MSIAEPHREGWIDEMEAGCQRELHARQQYGVQCPLHPRHWVPCDADTVPGRRCRVRLSATALPPARRRGGAADAALVIRSGGAGRRPVLPGARMGILAAHIGRWPRRRVRRQVRRKRRRVRGTRERGRGCGPPDDPRGPRSRRSSRQTPPAGASRADPPVEDVVDGRTRSPGAIEAAAELPPGRASSSRTSSANAPHAELTGRLERGTTTGGRTGDDVDHRPAVAPTEASCPEAAELAVIPGCWARGTSQYRSRGGRSGE
jgi:hypothetical protein